MNKFYITPNGIIGRPWQAPSDDGEQALFTKGGVMAYCPLDHLTEITEADAMAAYREDEKNDRERFQGHKDLDPEPWAFLDGYGRVGYRSYKPDFIRNPVFMPREGYEKNREYYA